MNTNDSSDQALIEDADALHSAISRLQYDLFVAIAAIDRRGLWRGDGARDMGHWLWMRYGLSSWKAGRWIQAAHALESLPSISEAFASGTLGVDKVVELCRFAAPQTEGRLVRWAEGVSAGAIRARGDREARRSLEDVQQVERTRSLTWWFEDEGRRFGLQASLPAASGAIVARALERLSERLPVMPGEENDWSADARKADALVALCSARLSADPDPDRATVVVHAQLESLVHGRGGCELEGGGVIHLQTARRLLCTGRVQIVMEDQHGEPVRLGRMRREPPAWMLRQLRHRDAGCRFPGCGSRRYTHAHHVVWWEKGGATDLDNLVLVCGFHHRLVHEHGWTISRDRDGEVRWVRPDGRRYRVGPGPPRRQSDREPALAFSDG
jgi:hypothetical protein